MPRQIPQPKMPQFKDILDTLGFDPIELLKDDPSWNMWRAVYPTPTHDLETFYLYLKSKCRVGAATDKNKRYWKNQSQDRGYWLVLPPSSNLARDPHETKQRFSAREVKTTRELIFDNVNRELKWNPVDEEEFFVDPAIMKLDDRTIFHEATPHMVEWLAGNDTSIAVLVAPGGVGKTTLARHLCTHFRSTGTYPVLIESQQWQPGHLTMDSVWDAALSMRFEGGSRLQNNEIARRVLIREGLLVVLFDGFDELCVRPEGAMSPKVIIDELVELAAPRDEETDSRARILFTARETFWESIRDDIDTSKLKVFRLQEFSTKKQQAYFKRRLTNKGERDTALRLSKETSSGVYGRYGSRNADRLSGVPFILDLIARFVHGNTDPKLNPYMTDPFADFLKQVCRRENIRQRLNIEADQQFKFFEELFRAYPESVSFQDLKYSLEIVCDVTEDEVVRRFTGHVFLTTLPPNTTGDSEEQRYRPHYEVISVYFLARFLAFRLVELVNDNASRKEILDLLAGSSSGETQVVDLLAEQLRQQDETKLQKAMRHARAMIAEETRQDVRRKSGMTLFHLAQKLLEETNDKEERTKQLIKLFSSNDHAKLIGITLAGQLRAYDFSETVFERCQFVDVTFKNCSFSPGTTFQQCSFIEGLEFARCKGASGIQVSEPTCSLRAEYELAVIRNTHVDQATKERLAEDALRRVLRQLRGRHGFSTVKYVDRIRFRSREPYNENVWDVLEECGVIERHKISGVADGGLNVRNDADLRRDIRAFLDNDVVDGALARVVAALIGTGGGSGGH